MRRLLFCCVLAAAAACGDNSNECDPGTTTNVDGVCTGTATCSDGTKLVDGSCQIDPNACQAGTVLVGGACVDPGQVKADIEEAAEPNGLGLIEGSANSAGELELKPTGQHLVVHGKIIPFRDSNNDGQLDADVDTYVITVEEPTMLSVSSDGINGLAGGFVAVANAAAGSPLAEWTRFGVNLTGDTSKRQLYLPEAGVYLLAIADSRSLLLAGGAAGAPEGKPAFEYYVTIDQVAATPTPLTVTNGTATSSGTRAPGEVKLFSVALGEGVNSAELDSASTQVQPSVVVTSTRAGIPRVRALADSEDGDPAEVSVLGIRTGDTQIVVVDSVIDYAAQPTDYALTVGVGTAAPLSTSGTPVSQPANQVDFSTFYYDVTAGGFLVGMNIAFDRPVSGVIVDENFTIFSRFTFGANGFAGTFQQYKGLLKHVKAGRYYFLTFDPTFMGAPATNITATATYAAVTPGVIVKGTPLTGQAITPFESNAYTYDPGVAADPWQTFTVTGTDTGTITAAFYNPSVVGRLDALTSTCTSCNDSPAPLFTHTYTAANPTRGRILLDPPTNLTTYLVTVNTATVTGTPTFSLDFKPQTNVNDLNTAAPGTPVTAADKTIDATTPIQRFIVRTGVGNRLTLNVAPDAAALNTRFQRVNADESPLGPVVDNGPAGAPDSATVLQGTAGYTAFVVGASAGTGTFDTTATAFAPVTYTTATGTTAYADACVGGATIALTDADEGSSALINAPAGFDFFGFAAPQLRVFSNGFVSFDPTVACGATCFFSNTDLPAAATPNAIAAPYWDDLVITSACQKTIGTKLVIQWSGTIFQVAGQAVQTQLIIDGSNDTLEFVYGPGHTATGAGATIGIENSLGSAAKKLSFNTANASPNTTFTPQ